MILHTTIPCSKLKGNTLDIPVASPGGANHDQYVSK
jgi:hypothetical protein